MDQYIATRLMKAEKGAPVMPGRILTEKQIRRKKLNESVGFLKIDGNIFLTAFQSTAYVSWLKDFVRDIDDSGLPAFPGITRNPETLIMYLKDLGVTTRQIFAAMYGPQSTYKQYLAQVAEFGKIAIE
jgi:hypothetical protein